MTINGSLLVSIPIVKRFSGENFLSRQNGSPKWWFFAKMEVYTLNFTFKTSKRHILARNRVFWRILREAQCGALAVGERKNPKKRNNSGTMRSYISPIWGEKNPGPIWIKFCIQGDIRDVITLANFWIDRFRGFSVARGQILGFSIGFCRRPYNTLALPCECVMPL